MSCSVEASAPCSVVPSRITTMFLILSALFVAVSAMPSYIAVPADQIAFVDLTALRAPRVPRQTLSPSPPLPHAFYDNYQPIPIQNIQTLQNYQQPNVALAPPPPPEVPARIQVQVQPQNEVVSPTINAAAHYAERPPDFGEYVDFGAHTGDNGAFGWYADYPINNHEESSYRK